ncbi:MAG: decaprenyl-phosphate phosphoribosyltransferase [Methanobacteriaceae archaeon]|nr:decaprenyl-phosphate phosphoribosyltransferase [Methanobacteriaceae archaeon]
MIKELFISMRPKQWYKNLVLFIGILFSGNLLNLNLFIDSVVAFLIFCLLSGSIYLINDIIDAEKDRKHPKKRNRPIPSGKLKVTHAVFFVIIFWIVAFTVAYFLNISFLGISLAFIILMLFYSFYLKNIIIVDILVISSGFVIRAMAGALAIGVFVSPWLIICAFLLALFLALGKRRHELILLKDEAKNHRKIMEGYTTSMLEQMITITTSTLIMSYSLYTFFVGNIYLMLTIPFAFYGLFRYLLLIHSKNLGGEPELIFKDQGMVLSLVFWAIIVFIVVYGPKIIGIWE